MLPLIINYSSAIKSYILFLVLHCVPYLNSQATKKLIVLNDLKLIYHKPYVKKNWKVGFSGLEHMVFKPPPSPWPNSFPVNIR